MFICWGSYFYYFSFFFFIILETNPAMLGPLTPPRPPRPPKYPKILGCLYTSPMCVSPLPRPLVPETWWNTGLIELALGQQVGNPPHPRHGSHCDLLSTRQKGREQGGIHAGEYRSEWKQGPQDGMVGGLRGRGMGAKMQTVGCS